MAPIITAFANSPDRGVGLARDMRVRWALEEVGQPYDVQLVTFPEMKQPDYRELNPFGQIPTYREDGLVLFESGAIVLHIAQKHQGLLPEDPAARARAITWMFSAVTTIEQPILEQQSAMFAEGDKPWTPERMPLVRERIFHRLRELSGYMDGSDWIDGGFSAADIMLVHVLRRLQPGKLLDGYPVLLDYIARAEQRPAYQRAFAAQRAVYTDRAQ